MSVGGIAGTTFGIGASEVTISLHVTDHRLGGIASSQLAFNDAENAALLARDEDAARALGVMTATALVDIAALDLAAGELFSGFDAALRV